MSFDPKVTEALTEARELVRRMGVQSIDAEMIRGLRQAFNTLDGAGVFAALDEQTDYASAEDILADKTVYDITPVAPWTASELDAEDRDAFEQDPPRQDGYAASSGLGKLERVPGTGTPKTHAEAARIAYAFVDESYDAGV